MQSDQHRSHPLGLGSLLSLCLVAGAPSLTSAQALARTFQELGVRVKAGDTVYITEDGGEQDRAVRILELTSSSLVVSVGGVRRELSEGTVSRIRQRLPDSRRNGALIGFLVGASATTTGAVVLASPSGSCKATCIAVNVAYGGGIGALVGLGIDSLIQGRKDIYLRADRRSARRVHVQPLVSSEVRGLRVSLRY